MPLRWQLRLCTGLPADLCAVALCAVALCGHRDMAKWRRRWQLRLCRNIWPPMPQYMAAPSQPMYYPCPGRVVLCSGRVVR